MPYIKSQKEMLLEDAKAEIRLLLAESDNLQEEAHRLLEKADSLRVEADYLQEKAKEVSAFVIEELLK